MPPLPLLVLTLAACGDPARTPCTLDAPGPLGFGFDDPCRHQCLARWTVTCPDGATVQPALCSGPEGCTAGSCGEGLVCHVFEDPFEDRPYCIPDDVCGTLSLPAEAAAWERASRARADALHEQTRRRRALQQKAKPTAPAASLPDVAAAPEADVAAPQAPEIAGHVLVDAWGDDLALVACLADGDVASGEACGARIPAGAPVVHAGWTGTSTGPKALACPAMAGLTAGVGVEGDTPVPGDASRWAWLPSPPPGWRPTPPRDLDPVLARIVRKELPQTVSASLTLAVQADLDGDAFEERVVRAHWDASDADKPGHTALVLVDDGSVAPLDTTGLEINGVQDVRGVVPLPGGGALLVFTTQWMGGSGLHAMAPRDGRLVALAEAVCGS